MSEQEKNPIVNPGDNNFDEEAWLQQLFDQEDRKKGALVRRRTSPLSKLDKYTTGYFQSVVRWNWLQLTGQVEKPVVCETRKKIIPHPSRRKFWLPDDGSITVATPFEFGPSYNVHLYPAVKDPTIFDAFYRTGRRIPWGEAEYDPTYFPRVYVTLLDPTLHRGDEQVRIHVEGLPRHLPFPAGRGQRININNTELLKWSLYSTGATGDINNREVALHELIQSFEKNILDASNGMIHLRPSDLYRSFELLAQYSPAIKDRFEHLREYLTFREYFMLHPEPILMHIASMFNGSIPESFVQLRREISTEFMRNSGNRMSTFTRFIERIDELSEQGENWDLTGGGAAPLMTQFAVMHYGPGEDLEAKLKGVPPSILIGLLGVKTINNYVREYLQRLAPELEAFPEAAAEAQVAQLRHMRRTIGIPNAAYNTHYGSTAEPSEAMKKAQASYEDFLRQATEAVINEMMSRDTLGRLKNGR